MADVRKTRNVALRVVALLKKMRNPNGLTLKTIHEHMSAAYPKNTPDRLTLNRILEKAQDLGALKKKYNRYVPGSVIKKISPHGIYSARRRRGKRRSRSRSRRRRGSRRRRRR